MPSMVGTALLAFMLAVLEFMVTGTPSIMMALLESRPPLTVNRPMDSKPSPTPPLPDCGAHPEHAGSQRRETVNVAAVERKIDDALVLDNTAESRGGGFD